MGKEVNKQPLWTWGFIKMIIIQIFNSLSFSMLMPNMTPFINSKVASLAMAGTITGLFSLASMFTRPLSGLLSDRFNRKQITLISNFGVAACIACYIIAPNTAMIAAVRVLHGFFFALSGTASITLATEFIPRERTGEGIAFFGYGNMIAGIISPYISIGIAEKLGYGQMLMVSAGFQLVAALITLTVNSKSRNTNANKKISFKNLIATECIFLALLSGLFSFSNSMISSYLRMLASDRNIQNVALFFSVSSMAIIVARPWWGIVLDKKGLKWVVYPCYIVAALSMFTIGAANSIVILVIASVLKTFGQGGGAPTIQAACIKRIEPERAGVATSTFMIGADLAQAFAPGIGGFIVAATNYTTMYNIVGVILLCGLALFAIYAKVTKLGESSTVKETQTKEA